MESQPGAGAPTARFFTDALERIKLRDGLKTKGEAAVALARIISTSDRVSEPSRVQHGAVEAWADGTSRPYAEQMLAAATELDMSIDDYLGPEDREESVRAAVSRIDDTLAKVLRGLKPEEAIPALRDLAHDLRELQEWRESQEQKRHAGEIG